MRLCHSDYVAGRRGLGDSDLDREPVACFTDALFRRLPYPGVESLIFLQSRANVPNINTMGDPGLEYISIIMDDDVCKGWRHWHSVLIKGVVYLGVD